MRNTSVIFSLHVHACFASFSSSDTFLYKAKSLDSSPMIEYDKINGEIDMPEHAAIRFQVDPENKIDILTIWVPADKTFYERGLKKGFTSHFNKDPAFLDLVSSYKSDGWAERADLPKDVLAAMERIHEGEEKHSIEVRASRGFVIPRWESGLPVESYRGALPDSVFLDFDLQSYLSGGGCHGYIGASERTFDTDRALMSVSEGRGISPHDLATFCAHSAGRHFADQLQTPEDVEKYFDDYFQTA